MLAEKQQIVNNVTIFENPFKDEFGFWKVRALRNNIVVKMTYCLNEEQAKIVRGEWINTFWGKSCN